MVKGKDIDIPKRIGELSKLTKTKWTMVGYSKSWM
jgi:hypothetical protein